MDFLCTFERAKRYLIVRKNVLRMRSVRLPAQTLHHLYIPATLTYGWLNLNVYIFFVLFAGNDLDSIRALFSEKEKELSLAVAKVEALTRQLEELRRDRRGPLNLISDNISSDGHNGQQNASPAALELDKLRRELMVISIHDFIYQLFFMVPAYIFYWVISQNNHI